MSTSGRSDLIEIPALLVHQTERAILIDAGLAKPVWLPKSRCEFTAPDHRGLVTVTLRESLAIAKGLV